MSKNKTKTIRVPAKLHARIKARVAKTGMKLEAWTAKILTEALV